MRSDLLGLAGFASVLSIIALITYFIARAVERKLTRSGKKQALLWGAITFVLAYFIILSAIGAVIIFNMRFRR